MDFSKSPKTESLKAFLEKATTFATFANESIETSFSYDQGAARLQPLILKYLNQEYTAFSSALVAYEKQTACFRMESWYSFYFQKLLKVMRGKDDIDASDQRPFHNLFAFPGGNHLTCLKALLQQEDLKERKIATIMAIHYFKPLIPNGTYIIDKSYQGKSSHCELCKEEIKYSDTTLGNIKTWHGKVDIILNRSIIKVTLEDELSSLEDEISDFQLNEDEFENPKLNEEEHEEAYLESQVLSESIVNAFYVSKQELNRNQFIPSYLVTEKYIRIILYNVKQDILLKSTKLPIWLDEEKGALDVMTLIRVWLTLNYAGKLDKVPERYEFLLKNIEKAGFKEMVGDAYSEYLNHIDQPLKASRTQKQVKRDVMFSKLDADEYQMIMEAVFGFTSEKK